MLTSKDVLEEKLLTPAQAAVVLSTDTATLEKWRYQGRGPKCLRVGFTTVYKMKDLLKFRGEQCLTMNKTEPLS